MNKQQIVAEIKANVRDQLKASAGTQRNAAMLALTLAEQTAALAHSIAQYKDRPELHDYPRIRNAWMNLVSTTLFLNRAYDEASGFGGFDQYSSTALRRLVEAEGAIRLAETAFSGLVINEPPEVGLRYDVVLHRIRDIRDRLGALVNIFQRLTRTS